MGLLDPDSLIDKDVVALSETVARCSAWLGAVLCKTAARPASALCHGPHVKQHRLSLCAQASKYGR